MTAVLSEFGNSSIWKTVSLAGQKSKKDLANLEDWLAIYVSTFVSNDQSDNMLVTIGKEHT